MVLDQKQPPSVHLMVDPFTHVSNTSSLLLLVDKLYHIVTGNVPMVLTNVVSPPGSYSVRIEASPGVEATVSYTITDSDSNGETH